MNKKVYVVRGSNDGILGVYTTPKRAWARAEKYVTACGCIMIEGSYEGYLKSNKIYSSHTVKGDDGSEAYINGQYLND